MSFNQKVQSAFKKLGAVALIIATLAMFFTACKQTGGGGGKPTLKPKRAITFSVDSTTPNGTLKAKADGITETSTSPITVEQGKTVTFTAKADDGYRVKGWTLEGKAVNGTNTEYKLTVTKPATVKVFFEEIPPTKHTVTLNQTEHGTVTALPEIPADKLVEEGKTVTLTATANDGYRVGTWVISPSEALQSGGNKGETTATVKITADTSVSVNFELIPEQAVLTLNPNKLTIGISVKTADGKPIEVEGCTETTFASDEDAELHATGTVVTLRGKITKLECNDNQLVALNVKKLTSLEELLCRKNQLTDLDASGLTALKTLGCNGNKLTSLNVSGCTALQNLGCFRNQLASLNVQGLTSLEALGCHGNQLTTLDISGLTALKRLSCHNNKLEPQAMTELLKALPAREASNDVKATLYSEKTEPVEGNCKDFNTPAELKTAFKEAKGRNWKLKKEKTDGTEVDILFTYAINFGVEGSGGKLTAQADGVAETETSPINVEEGKTVTFTATPDAGYAVDNWTITGGSFENGSGTVYNDTAKLIVTANTEVKVRFIQGTVYTVEGVRFMMKDIAAVTNGMVGHNDQANNLPHQVNISAYRIGETEVTQELWQAVMGENSSRFKDSLKNPVENVNWYECIVFCNELTKKVTGSDNECVYRVLGIVYDKKALEANQIPEIRGDKKGFRLPYENEWEWAAKGGTEYKWPGTNDETKLGEYAWYRGSNAWKTHEVKMKKPNGYGLYDMSGNVMEFCWEKYSSSSDARLARGGNWDSRTATHISRAFKEWLPSKNRDSDRGLRVVCGQ